mgnify:FL=1
MKSVKLTAVTAAVIATAMLPGAWAAEHAMNADVVVIGAGGAGMAASVKAAENGAKVVLLEKNAFIGGGAAFAEGLYGIETEWQRSKNYGLSSAESSKYVQRFHHFKADGKLNRLFMDESAKSLEWLAKHDITFEAIQVSPAETMTWHVIGKYKDTNHGAAYIAALKDHADKLGVKTMVGTPAKSLIMKNGKVAGVKAEDGDGETYTITTSQVILATGGFGDNRDMIRSELHQDPDHVKASVPLNKTGDGIQMAWAAGADRTPMTAVLHPGTEGKGIKFLSNLYVMSWQPFNMWVNNRGERFAPETLTFEFSLAGNAIESQYQNYGWAIFDDAAIDYVNTKGVDVGVGVLIPTKTQLTNLKKELDEAVKMGSDSVKTASSVKALAKKIGVPADALAATYADYNKAARVHYDGDFFKEAQWLRPIDKGNLYAVRVQPYFFCTLGGVRVDRGMHVLDKNDKPIPGLYAAGVDAGGLWSDTYTTWTSGHAFGFAAWSGQKAAENAVKALKK